MLLRCFLSVLLFALGSSAGAAPPTLAALFPPGAGRGSTVEVTASGTFERWPVQVWVEGTGVQVKPGREKGKLTVTVAADAIPGVRRLRLFDEQGASVARPFIIGVLPEVNEQEPNDDSRKPHVLPKLGVTVNGRLERRGDVDCFALDLKAGRTLVASLDANRSLASPMDGVLQILSSTGFVLAENNDYHGLDPQITFAVPKDGTYIVRLFAFPAVPDASINLAGGERFTYRLTLTTGGWVDHAFPMAVSRSSPGTVDLLGWNIPEADRKRTVTPGAGFADSVLVFHPEAAGTALVRVEPHPTLTHIDPGDRKAPQSIEIPATISGRIERARTVHAYQFKGRKGQRLTFQIEATSLGFPWEPVLRLTDATARVLAQAQSPALATDPTLSFVVPADGMYRIEVSDLLDHGSPQHLYRLRVSEPEPDFALTCAADAFVLTPGKPLDVVVTVERRNGFTGAIDLSAEGLPAGVSAAVVPAAPAPTLTVRLTADKGAAAGGSPIRIVGRSKTGKEIAHPVRVRSTEYNTTTDNLWLTLAPGR
jgi:hypothetical protein